MLKCDIGFLYFISHLRLKMLKPVLVFVFLGLSMSITDASLKREEFETINVNGNFFEVYTFNNLSDRISYSFFYNYSQVILKLLPFFFIIIIDIYLIYCFFFFFVHPIVPNSRSTESRGHINQSKN